MDWKSYATVPVKFECRLDDTELELDVLDVETLTSAVSGMDVPDYLRKMHAGWIASGDIGRAYLLKEKRKYVFTHYGEVVLGDPIDWRLGQPGSNNLSWQLHSLSFLKDLIKAHLETDDDAWLDCVRDIVVDWATGNICDPPPSIFSWNDHSTAFRLTALGQAFLHFLPRAEKYEALIRRLLELAKRHQQVLLSERFYSKGTNHGLDQAYALYQSTFFFRVLADRDAVREIARQRLAYELSKSFAEDRVHIENSPEYHASILSSTLQINATADLLEGRPLLDEFEPFVNGALEYLAYVVRPDGKFPPIGDTLLAAPKQDFKWLAKYKNFAGYEYARTCGESGRDFEAWHKVFPHAGYAIFRGDPEIFSAARRPHLTYKCGFLSHYHRQDDDNHVVLFALGKEWLTDGGLYVHDHGVPEREYMRSPLAHNVMVPHGVEALRRNPPTPPPVVVEYSVNNGGAYVQGRTTAFPGYICTRSVRYDGRYEFGIDDKVEAVSDGDVPVVQYWQIPFEHAVAVGPNYFIVSCRDTPDAMIVEIDSEHLAGIEVANGKDGILGLRSKSYGTLEPVTVVRVFYGKAPVSAKVCIRFASAPSIE